MASQLILTLALQQRRSGRIAAVAEPVLQPISGEYVPTAQASLNEIRDQLTQALDKINQAIRGKAIADAHALPPPRQAAFQSNGDQPTLNYNKPLDRQLDVRFSGWPVRDQGTPENCVAFSAIACFEHYMLRDEEDKPAYSAQFLVHGIKTDTDDHDRDTGYTYLRWAYEALVKDGTCVEELFPYTGGIAAMTSPSNVAKASARQFDGHIFYRDLLGNHGELDAARIVYECLRQNQRPVAMSLPIFPDDPSGGFYQTNWTNHAAVHHGAVADPKEGVDRIGEHCVCVTGFIPSQSGEAGGHFVFRNSWGTKWAQYAPSSLPGPTGPEPGYGVVSEMYVNKHCAELLQLY